ncbi:MAG: outer membrane lipoprotein carrier protein LolA [Bacteroidales bacterium]
MTIKKLQLALVMLMMASLSYAQVDDAKSKKILNEASEKLQSQKDIRIDFTYSMENTEYDLKEEKKGSALIKGNKYKLNLGNQMIFSDAQTVWTYLPESNEVQIASAEGLEDNNPLEILTNWEKEYRSKYIRTEFVSGNTIDIIDLVPLEGKSFFKVRLRILQDSKQLVSSTIFDKNATTYTYIIEDYKTNKGLPDSTFQFNKSNHPDVEVIDLR